MATTKATVNPASEKVTNEIIRLKHLNATSLVVKIEDVLKFLEDISNEQLQENILSIYAKLYHKYEADKHFIPEGNLVEIRFEDYEKNAFDLTQEIYQKLSLPGFEEARSDIEAYVNKKKGYKKNKYQYKPETVDLVEKNWSFALEQWNYKL